MTSDLYIDQLVSMYGVPVAPDVYRKALISFRELVKAEFCLAIALDLKTVSLALSDPKHG